MTPYVDDRDFQLYVGDVRQVLAGLPAESVDCVVTSPPYWGLRDYGTGQWAGGNPDCDHLGAPFRTKAGINASCGTGTDRKNAADREPMGQTCSKCGASRVDQQVGLEATPELFVQEMVAVFREVRRVLARHGTLWLNLGDSYTGPKGNTRGDGAGGGKERGEKMFGGATGGMAIPEGLKVKDLVGIPWRVAFALQADGWYLRADIIWSKPNPMPESVTDRPTKAHEYVFLLSKQPRYFFDAEAVREEYAPKTLTHRGGGKAAGKVGQQDGVGKVASGNFGEWDKPRTAYPRPTPQDETLDGFYECSRCGLVKTKTTERASEGCGACGGALRIYSGEAPRGPDGRRATNVKGADGSIQHRDGERWPNGGRNVRSVWEIATQPYPDAHFATFPEALPERCIKAGCPEQVCVTCGEPRVRIVESVGTYDERKALGYDKAQNMVVGGHPGHHNGLHPPGMSHDLTPKERIDRGLSDCGHGNYRTGVVLDPFMGSGTTALVARRLGRRSIGVELNEAYAALCARRLQQLSLFAEEAV